MSKKRIALLFILLIILCQFFGQTYAVSENIEEEDYIEDEPLDTDIYGGFDYIDEDKIELEEVENIKLNNDIGISLMSASGSGTRVGNETEFSNAFYNTSVSEITTSTNIRLTSTYTTNHNLKISTSSSTGNALQLSSGCKIIVAKGCVLTIDSMVIDGRQFGNNDEKSCIVVQSGAALMLTDHSIIDGGTKNWGIEVQDGGQLFVESCQISNCYRGIVVKGNSYCGLGDSTAVAWWGDTKKSVDFTYNDTGIYCGGNYSGALVVNNTSNTNDKTNFEHNSQAIFVETHTGSITVSHARMAYNNWGIHTYGNMTINDINAAYNNFGLVNQGGTVNFKGGGFYADSSNLNDYGIYNNAGTLNVQGGFIYNANAGIWNAGTVNMSAGNIKNNKTGIENRGILNFTGGNIISNSSYDIYQIKNNYDSYGGLRIERNDTLSSKIYLSGSDSYIYTGSKIPTFSAITLGSVNLERLIIRASNTTNASTMNNKITVTNKGSYYYKANATGYTNYVVLWANYTVTTYHKTSAGAILGSSSKTYAYKDSYTTSASTFDGYNLATTPTNASGIVSGNIDVIYYYDAIVIPNVAVVNYSDLLSGVVSAKYWKDNFSGSGTEFENGKIFEEYGNYKVVVTDGVGLSKTITFSLNENSV